MKSTVPRLVSALFTCLMVFGPAPSEAQQAQPDLLSVTLGVLQQRLQEAITKKDYQTMESLTRTMSKLAPQWPDAHYNLACALAMQGRKDEAVEALTQSVALGFANAPLMESDADLASLRELPAFQASLAVAKRAYEVAMAGQTPQPGAAPATPGGATPAPLGPMPEVRARISGSTPLVTKNPAATGSKVGTKVKALWRGQWWPATITAEGNGQFHVRYDSGTDVNDEWLTPDKVSFPSTDGLPVAGDKVRVTWGGSLYESVVQRREGQKWRIHYEGFPENMDETVGLDRLRDLKGQPFTPKADGAAVQPTPGDGPANGIQDPGGLVPRFLPRPAPPAAADALDWVYLETKINPKEGAGWKFLAYRFMPDGIVARDYLHSTVEAFDFEARQKVDPAYYGVYKREGGLVSLTFASGLERSFALTDAAPAPKLSGLTRAGKLKPGHSLNGKYVAESRLAVDGKDGYSRSVAVWFSADGSMRTTEDIFQFGGKVGTNFQVQPAEPKAATGTYSVDGWVLNYTLNGVSDKSVIFTFDLEETGSAPPVLDFMGMTWGRE